MICNAPGVTPHMTLNVCVKDVACLCLTGDPEECHFFFQSTAELPLALLDISNVKYGHENYFVFDGCVQSDQRRTEGKESSV